MEGKISVVVPVYNVEKYLDRCINSIVSQTYENLEIILVDDCSPDRSPQMCDEWANKDNRIRVIHKPLNEGLGFARNTGMDAATGEWISFVDSDDYLNINTYAECMRTTEKSKADICYFDAIRVSVNDNATKGKRNVPVIFSGKQVTDELLPLCFGSLPGDKYEIGAVWAGIYNRLLLKENNIRFHSERELISEDYVFTQEVCSAASSVVFINQHFYHYCVNTESLSRSYKSDRFEKTVFFHQNRMQEISRLNLGRETEIRAAMRYWIMVLAAVKLDVNTDALSFWEKLKRIRKISNHPFSKELNIADVRKYMNAKKKLFLFAMKMKSALGVYLLVKMKNYEPK